MAAIGLSIASQENHQLWTLNSVRIPDGVDDAEVRGALLDEFNIEIGGGLGPLKGKTWRIGLMGESSTTANVLLVLSALERVLPRYGHRGRGRRGGRGGGARVRSERGVVSDRAGSAPSTARDLHPSPPPRGSGRWRREIESAARVPSLRTCLPPL